MSLNLKNLRINVGGMLTDSGAHQSPHALWRGALLAAPLLSLLHVSHRERPPVLSDRPSRRLPGRLTCYFFSVSLVRVR